MLNNIMATLEPLKRFEWPHLPTRVEATILNNNMEVVSVMVNFDDADESVVNGFFAQFDKTFRRDATHHQAMSIMYEFPFTEVHIVAFVSKEYINA